MYLLEKRREVLFTLCEVRECKRCPKSGAGNNNAVIQTNTPLLGMWLGSLVYLKSSFLNEENETISQATSLKRCNCGAKRTKPMLLFWHAVSHSRLKTVTRTPSHAKLRRMHSAFILN